MAADVDTALYSWSTSESSNKPTGSTTIGANLDDNLRQIQATVRAWLANKGADIASASTTDLGAVAGLAHDITGTTTITSFGAVAAGIWKIIKFEGALTLTHNGTSLILPGAENITTADGDIAIFISEGSGNWRCVSYFPAAINPAKIVSTDEMQTLTNKTLTSATLTTPTINTAASVGGTWTAAATWTLPAHTLGGTVTLNGQSFSGAASFSSTIAITGAATLSSTLAVTGAATLSSTVDIVGNASIGANGASSISLAVNAAAAASRTIFFQTAGVNRWYLRTNNTAESGANAGSDFVIVARDDSGNNIGEAISIKRSTMAVNFAGNVRIGSATAPTVPLDVTGAALISSTLGVTGATTLSSTLAVTGNVSVNTDKFTVTASSGNTAVAGTLGVTGAATLSSTLSVTGNFTINTDKFSVTAASGNTSVAGTFSVTGNVSVNTNKFSVTASTGDTVIAGKATVTSDIVGGNNTADTTRATGYVYASVVNNTPTGTPTGGPFGNGSGALAYDYNNGVLYIYNHTFAGWNSVALS